MVQGHVVENNGLLWRFTLREELKFNDGTPVRGRDCIASIRRWAVRDAMGQVLLARTEDLAAPDDRSIVCRLRRPFPLLFDALARVTPPVCCIMPERIAATPLTEAITDIVGSGPFRFVAEDRVAGSRIAHPPFDRAPIRRALLHTIDKVEFMTAVVGADRSLVRGDVGVFAPGAPLANEEGMEVLKGDRDIERVKREIAEAGYGGEKVVLLAASDFPTRAALANAGAALLRRVGVEVELVSDAWAAILRRRASRAAPGAGGWNMFVTVWSGLDLLHPGVHQALRGTGERAWFGWPSLPRVEELRNGWFEAPDLPAQQRIARAIQAEALREAPFLPLGRYFQATAYRRDISELLKGLPLFWNVQHE